MSRELIAQWPNEVLHITKGMLLICLVEDPFPDTEISVCTMSPESDRLPSYDTSP